MLDLIQTSKFKKDYKRMVKQGRDMSLLKEVIDTLQRQESLDKKYLDHALLGNWKGFRECHIESDWLLIYRVNGQALTLTASRTGSHAEILNL